MPRAIVATISFALFLLMFIIPASACTVTNTNPCSGLAGPFGQASERKASTVRKPHVRKARKVRAAKRFRRSPVAQITKAVVNTAKTIGGYADHVANETIKAMDCAGKTVTAGAGLTTVRTPSGKCFTVAKANARQFYGFVRDFENAGYQIKFIGGYSRRKIAGTRIWSKHASGRAIDICQTGRNRVACKMPPNVTAMASKYGLTHGAVWSNPDAGHFEIPGWARVAKAKVHKRTNYASARKRKWNG